MKGRNATVSMIVGEDLECHNFVISGVDMGALKGNKAIMMIGDKEGDFTPSDWMKPFMFTATISEEDCRKFINLYMRIVYPYLTQCQYIYKRTILNPKYTKYKAYLRRRK